MNLIKMQNIKNNLNRFLCLKQLLFKETHTHTHTKAIKRVLI